MLVRTDANGTRALRWYASVIAAVAGGLLLDAATPGLSWWPLAFPAVALVCAAVWQQRARWGFLVGALAGAAFWMPHIGWLTLYLGPIPWAALCALMILWFGLFGVAAAVATRGLRRIAILRRSAAALAGAQAASVAGLWMLREQLQGAIPYGGFAWGRLATTQADGPLLQSVSWLGFAGLSALLAFASVVPVAVALVARDRGASVRPVLVGVAASLAVLVALAALPAAPLEQSGTLRVAAVQGNSKSGIFDDREAGGVIRDHFTATEELLDRLEAEGRTVDVIVWPENSAEFAAPDQLIRSQRLAKLAERAGAPIVVGTVLANEDGTYSNSSLVWNSEGPTDARYDKRYPVPFAEYMPNRPFFRAIVPDLVDLVQLEYAPGTRPSALEVDTSAGVIRAGIAICFDIIFDPQAVAMASDGAQVIFAQTNNADFGRTDESAQQLAIARTRAVEMGRAVVNDSTVGTSAVVAPDGRSLDELQPFTRDAMVAEVPLVEGLTPALRFGGATASVGALVGVLGLAGGVFGLVRARRVSRHG
ncbi:apolipoprotein N-acyltransferase [Leucobacter sp. Marseille-Q4368]|uniref:Apolipoprotein N-acyltransferase n=2 Tax=Leucobacter manosquensis TaxID=2810611 RepID=A0ABS5M2G8_9MICO|nr:apolipoprotein N-acyltransferase [Leucobacter manosquensis]MBS3181352.1 apolipoprotein N-acyltransferase [Leucobacter manosquensis]